MLRAHPHFLLARACNSLSFSLTGEQGSHTLFTGQRERERERGREGEEKEVSVRKREGERERERVCEKEGERVKQIMCFNCPELLFLKGMTGALAPLSYLVV
jgi:hypothetical protein